MASLTGAATKSYLHRTDETRVRKSGSSDSTVYGYDLLMGMEEIYPDRSGVLQKATAYSASAREVDTISVTQSGTVCVSYPIYDAHGNMVATLAKSGTNGYQVGNLRSFDAWGNVRINGSISEAKGR